MNIPAHAGPGYREDRTEKIEEAMKRLVRPPSGYLGCTEVIATALNLPGAVLIELRSAPGGKPAQRLLALRYLIANGGIWHHHFAWQKPVDKLERGASVKAEALFARLAAINADDKLLSKAQKLIERKELKKISAQLEDLESDDALALLTLLNDSELRQPLNDEVRSKTQSYKDRKEVDLLFLASGDLTRFPATTVGGGQLKYVIVADKGEMGTRAVREALLADLIPVVVFNQQDDEGALQVRLAEEGGGFAIPLAGGFRESYGNPSQIAERVLKTFSERFGDEAAVELEKAALYPGYGPLAENTAAIQTFRRSGIIFIGPMQDVVEKAGDKRKFRALAEEIDEKAVTPGIVMASADAQEIFDAVEAGYKAKKFEYPGRLKAANGGGGRGQAVISDPSGLKGAIQKVLAEIQANAWDPGVMFEQNIFETIHLEVQVVRDRFGNVRHFGMRDCSEQRASQKIQEEAPPALLRNKPELSERICKIACDLADAVDYVGACTVELMYKNDHFYLLEMNTRIQVEHPVSEEAHRIYKGRKEEPLNLVQLQYRVANGLALPFEQKDVHCTHVAREFRINAEAYKPELKDSRDGKKGLFLPNAGIFDRIDIPTKEASLAALKKHGIDEVQDLVVRFDCGFEVGDDLVNKDPTFGKLIVAIQPIAKAKTSAYELLRRSSIAVLNLMKIEGRQLTPSKKIVDGVEFETNLSDHIHLLHSSMLQEHSQSDAKTRHVGWVLDYLRSEHD